MSDALPTGESLRRAVRYISERLQEDASQPLLSLVDQASQRFDLTPKESEYLIQFYREAMREKSRQDS
jgi:hypothetical protein